MSDTESKSSIPTNKSVLPTDPMASTSKQSNVDTKSVINRNQHLPINNNNMLTFRDVEESLQKHMMVKDAALNTIFKRF